MSPRPKPTSGTTGRDGNCVSSYYSHAWKCVRYKYTYVHAILYVWEINNCYSFQSKHKVNENEGKMNDFPEEIWYSWPLSYEFLSIILCRSVRCIYKVNIVFCIERELILWRNWNMNFNFNKGWERFRKSFVPCEKWFFNELSLLARFYSNIMYFIRHFRF